MGRVSEANAASGLRWCRVFVEPALQHQLGGDGIDGVVAVTTALAALGHTLALGLKSGQAFIVFVSGQIETAIETVGKLFGPRAKICQSPEWPLQSARVYPR